MLKDKKPWEIEAPQTKTDEDLRGTFRHDMDKSMGRAMTRYMNDLLEWIFPNITLKITSGVWKISVSSSTTHTCPTTTINGDVIINGNLNVNGNVYVTGDVIAGGVSLRTHTHPGCMGGSTGQPHGGGGE